MPVVTVTGTGGSTVSLSYNTSEGYTLAAQIAQVINSAIATGAMTVKGTVGSVPTVVTTPSVYEQLTSGVVSLLGKGYADYVNAAPNANVTGSGLPNESIVNGPGNMTFYAAGGSGTIAGGDGKNNINIPMSDSGSWYIGLGNGTNTIIDYGTGNDSILTGLGQNAVTTGGGTYLIRSIGNDTVTTGSGADTVDATGSGPSASVVVNAGPGPLTFLGGGGAATILGSTGSESVMGGSGPLYAKAGTGGNSDLVAGTGAATLFGAASGDSLAAGGSSAAQLMAGAGNETLYGGSGASTLTGGTGPDTFAFSSVVGGATDVVNGFVTGTDMLALLGGLTITNQHTVPGGSGTNLVVTLSDNTHITFTGLSQNFT